MSTFFNPIRVYMSEKIAKQEIAQARAERLRRLRNLANLSRKEICDADNLNVNTYKGWELSRFGGLPTDGAKRVISRVATEGVICSIDWLLDGNGTPPEVMIDTTTSTKLNKQCNNSTIINQEFELFKQNHSEAIFSVIKNNNLLPIYSKGDVVAGIKHYHSKIKETIGHVCIIQTIDGIIDIRYVKQPTTGELYNLTYTNFKENSLEIFELTNQKLLFSAPISRIYKTLKLESSTKL